MTCPLRARAGARRAKNTLRRYESKPTSTKPPTTGAWRSLAWPKPPLFSWLQRLGSIADAEMDRVFNMGIGFVVVCRPEVAERALANLSDSGLTAWHIGEVRSGDVGVTIL